jgi:hypothetical protein
MIEIIPSCRSLVLGFATPLPFISIHCLSFHYDFYAHTSFTIDGFLARGIALVCSYKPSLRAMFG